MFFRILRRFSSALIALTIAPLASNASWPPSGNAVCTAPGVQELPLVARDESGGAILFWGDGRTGSYEAFGQRLSASGEVIAGWSEDGLRLAGSIGGQVGILNDQQGGFYIVYGRFGSGADLYAQHVTGSGAPVPGWPADGLAIVTSSGSQFGTEPAADDSGGIFIVWDDYRVFQVRGVRLHSDGTLAPGWPAGGKLLSTPGSPAGGADIEADGTGGFFAVWNEVRGGSSGAIAYAFHFTSSGTPAPGWSATGTPMHVAPESNMVPYMAVDGVGGVYAVWADFRSAPPGAVPGGFDDEYFDIYAQHVTANGSIAPGWPADGLPICTLFEIQKYPSIIADGLGGMIATWQDYRDFYLQTYAQRINPDGTRAGGWPENGLLVQPSTHAIEARRLVPDGVGGAYFGVEDFSVSRCFVQHVLGNGTYDPTYGPQARPVSDTPSSQHEIAVAEDGVGGVYAAWNTGDNIWAQHFAPEIPTAVAVSLVDASADPGIAHLAWQVTGAVAAIFTLERAGGGGVFVSVATLSPNGAGRLIYEDVVSEAGRYVYRLSFVEDGVRRTTPEVELQIPSAFILSLSGFTPNPVRAGGGAVAFTLPRTAPGALVFYDLAGRSCFRRDVGSLGPGRHTLSLAGARLRSGVYWIRLTHDGRAVTTRGVVVQ